MVDCPLPETGSNASLSVLIAFLVLGTGIALLIVRRRGLGSGAAVVLALALTSIAVSGGRTADAASCIPSTTVAPTAPATSTTTAPPTTTTVAATTPTATTTTTNVATTTTAPSVTVTPPQPQADLALTKAVSDPTPDVGETVDFTVTASNVGPDAATDVQVTDLLPAGLVFVSATPSQGSYTAGTGLWNVGTLASGASATLTVDATVVSPTLQINTATVDADQFDPDTANNTASATVTAEDADLALTKSVSNSTPNVGETVTFTVTLSDNGPDVATGVRVSDVLPAGLTFVSATPSQGTYDPSTGLWNVGAIAVAAPQTLTLTATVVASSAQTNTAALAGADQFDPNAGNNTASATLTPQRADLILAKSVSNPTPNVGDPVTFTVTLTDLGPDTATGVQVIDMLPAGLAFVSASASQGSYDSSTGVWFVGVINAGASLTLTVTATVASPGARINTVTVSNADQFDPDTTNNTASVTITAP